MATRQIHRRGANANYVVSLANSNAGVSERADLDLPATDQVRAAGYDPWYDLDERLLHVIFGKRDTPLPDTMFTVVIPVLYARIST